MKGDDKIYGKIFQRMYQGSMVGAGSCVFAVWGYCIACADPEDHTVELNPILLATIIGDSEENVKLAIQFLCSPDEKSHCREHGGARLLPVGGYQYLVVTHAEYRDMKNNDELRAYFREKKRESRMSLTVKDSLKTPASASDNIKEEYSDPEFNAFWKEYPKKQAKLLAFQKWKSSAKTRPPIAAIITAILAQSRSDQWKKNGGQYIPMPSTWLNQGRWADEPVKPRERTINI